MRGSNEKMTWSSSVVTRHDRRGSCVVMTADGPASSLTAAIVSTAEYSVNAVIGWQPWYITDKLRDIHDFIYLKWIMSIIDNLVNICAILFQRHMNCSTTWKTRSRLTCWKPIQVSHFCSVFKNNQRMFSVKICKGLSLSLLSVLSVYACILWSLEPLVSNVVH